MDKKIDGLNLCIKISVPTVEDGSVSLYEAVCNLATALNEVIEELNNNSIVTSINGKSGKVTLTYADVGALPSSYKAPVQKVNGKTGDVTITAESINALPDTYKAIGTAAVIEGGTVPELSQPELRDYYNRGFRILFNYGEVGTSTVEGYYIEEIGGDINVARFN